jgi:hypothetical protein
MPCPRSTLASVLIPIAALSVTGVDDAEPPASAAEGLERLAAAYEDWPSARPLGECPLIDGAAIDAALEVAGIDAQLAGWELSAVDGEPARVTCRGEYVGALGDEQFPEVVLELSATVVDAGLDLPATDCERTALLSDCAAAQAHDGVAVAVRIADRVFLDAATTDAVLDEVVPDAIGSLSEAATDVADPLAVIGAEDVIAAQNGFAEFVASASEGERLGCRAISATAVAAALADAGIDSDLAGWSGTLEPVTFPDDLEPPPTRLACADGTELATVSVIDFAEPAAADEFVASVGQPGGGSAADLQPGDLTVGSCTTVEDSTGRLDYCQEWWRSDGLVIGVALFGPSATIGPTDAATVLVAIVQSVLRAFTEVP